MEQFDFFRHWFFYCFVPSIVWISTFDQILSSKKSSSKISLKRFFNFIYDHLFFKTLSSFHELPTPKPCKINKDIWINHAIETNIRAVAIWPNKLLFHLRLVLFASIFLSTHDLLLNILDRVAHIKVHSQKSIAYEPALNLKPEIDDKLKKHRIVCLSRRFPFFCDRCVDEVTLGQT